MSVHRFNEEKTVSSLPVSQRKLRVVRSNKNALLLTLLALYFGLYVVFRQSSFMKTQAHRQQLELSKTMLRLSLYNKSFIAEKLAEIINNDTLKLHELYIEKNKLFYEYDQYKKRTGHSSYFIQSKTSYLERKISISLYEKEEDRGKRIHFHKRRLTIADKNPSIRNLKLTKYNMLTDLINENDREADLRENYQELRQTYQFDLVKTQLPMCVIVLGYNNNVDFRVELNLNSIFQQNYTNYKVVIIDDASDDGTVQLIQRYLDFHQKSKEKSRLILNKQRDGTLLIIYKNVRSNCDPNDVVLIIDGNDQLIGSNVFQTLNAVFQLQKAGLVYSTPVLVNDLTNQTTVDWSRSLKETQIQANSYRQGNIKYSQLRAWRVSLFLEIKEQDLQDGYGGFLRMDHQMHIVLPLLELACGRVIWLDENQYLKNLKTTDGILEDEERELKRLKKGSKYECSKTFMEDIYRNEKEVGPKRQ